MIFEKEENNVKWYRQNQLKVKAQSLDNNTMLWVTLKNYNICLKLGMYDILDKIRDEILIEVKICRDLNNQRTFLVDSNNVEELITYIENFVNEWNIQITKDTVSESDYIDDEIWYKVY